MKTKLFTLLALTCMMLSSCNNELDESQIAIINETNTVFKQSDGILTFDNEADFRKAVETMRNNQSETTTFTRSASGEGFTSIYDEFDEAMNEADDYYQREGGYEEFKLKFPNLYYPEHGEDYAAFLPVSDEAVAKLLNQQGKVIIAGEEKDLRDVDSYEKIQELGLGMPEYENTDENPSTRAFTDIKYLTLSKEKMNKKRKAWITLRGIEVSDKKSKDGSKVKLGRVDLCFRKKGAVHWYNGKMTSRGYGYTKEGYRRPIKSQELKELEYSPHKYYVSASRYYQTINPSELDYLKLEFRCGEDYPKYSFTGFYTVDINHLMSLNNGTGFGEDLASFLVNWGLWLIPVAVTIILL
ncbi:MULTISPECIES: hypothetical protein [Proteiniphilum]|jgi:hypothetical protein|nr:MULTISPECIES: hypothetical protein [Proteiniphilum]ULB34959.1 hypothetical protein KDN43_02590 [Proteiniphilum propionicum]